MWYNYMHYINLHFTYLLIFYLSCACCECSAGDGDSVLNRVEKGYFEKKIPVEGIDTTQHCTI